MFRVAGSSVIDAWTGYTIIDRCDASIEGLLRIAHSAGRPIDVEVEARSWFCIWPDGCQAAIREPASMACKREIDQKRRKATRKSCVSARFQCIGDSCRLPKLWFRRCRHAVQPFSRWSQ